MVFAFDSICAQVGQDCTIAFPTTVLPLMGKRGQVNLKGLLKEIPRVDENKMAPHLPYWMEASVFPLARTPTPH